MLEIQLQSANTSHFLCFWTPVAIRSNIIANKHCSTSLFFSLSLSCFFPSTILGSPLQILNCSHPFNTYPPSFFLTIVPLILEILFSYYRWAILMQHNNILYSSPTHRAAATTILFIYLSIFIKFICHPSHYSMTSYLLTKEHSKWPTIKDNLTFDH